MSNESPEGWPSPPWKALFDSDDFPREFQKTFDAAFFDQLAAHAGEGADRADLLAGVESAVRAYLHAQLEMRLKKPGKRETQRLERVADAAHGLAVALDRIEGVGNAELKLAVMLRDATQNAPGRGAALLDLARLRQGPGDPTRALRDIAGHLAGAAARAVDKKPGEPSDDGRERGAAIYDRELSEWRAGAFKRPNSFPLYRLVEAFRPVWQRNSDHPYILGMYYSEIGRTVSHAVDALHLIATRLDPTVPRSRVTTALRRANAARKSSSSDS